MLHYFLRFNYILFNAGERVYDFNDAEDDNTDVEDIERSSDIPESESISEPDNYYENQLRNSTTKYFWGEWSHLIYLEASKFVGEEGNGLNPYYLHKIDLCDKLLKDLEIFPIWGNTLASEYEYDRIPASSAPIEGEFRKIKADLMRDVHHSIRVDAFVDKHLNYLQGKLLLVHANIDKVMESPESTVENIDQAQIY